MDNNENFRRVALVKDVMDLVYRFQDQIKLVVFSTPIGSTCECTITFNNLLDVCPTSKSESLVMAINWFIRKCNAVLSADTCSDQLQVKFLCQIYNVD